LLAAPGGGGGAAAARPTQAKSALGLLFCFFGLQASYLCWGVFQERIMTLEYGESRQGGDARPNTEMRGLLPCRNVTILTRGAGNSKFTNSEFLVLLNRMSATSVAYVVIYRRRK
jgi:hypothetical protein